MSNAAPQEKTGQLAPDILADDRGEAPAGAAPGDCERSSRNRAIVLEEGYRYWTHEGYITRYNDETEQTELLGPGGWTPAL